MKNPFASIKERVKSDRRRIKKMSAIDKKMLECEIKYTRAAEATSGEEYCCSKQELLALEVPYGIYDELQCAYFFKALLRSKDDFVLVIKDEDFELPKTNPDGTPYLLHKQVEAILKQNNFIIRCVAHVKGRKEYHVVEDVLYWV